jgi:RNAse (barnase) inhibitor barstar
MTANVELSALLADPAQCGAYYIDLHDRAAIAEAANLLEFALVAIDFRGCAGKDDALERFAEALKFPDWFGDNWDALADCHSDQSWWPAGGYVLLLDHVDDWRQRATVDCDVVIDILNEVAEGWAQARTPFWSLLPLPAEALASLSG